MSAATDGPACGQRVELHLAVTQSRDAFDTWRFALKDMFEVTLGADKPAMMSALGLASRCACSRHST
ncbi:MAG: hypothetical protein WA280_08850 [Xanthobacteraceae bacterium]